MKRCSKCGVRKSLSEFYRNAAKPSGRHSSCKSCMKAYSRDYHTRNRTEVLKKRRRESKKRRGELRDMARFIKEFKGCEVCGITTPSCLQFHHASDDKELSVSRAITDRWRLGRLIDEMRKCVVLCANCHAMLHAGEIEL